MFFTISGRVLIQNCFLDQGVFIKRVMSNRTIFTSAIRKTFWLDVSVCFAFVSVNGASNVNRYSFEWSSRWECLIVAFGHFCELLLQRTTYLFPASHLWRRASQTFWRVLVKPKCPPEIPPRTSFLAFDLASAELSATSQLHPPGLRGHSSAVNTGPSMPSISEIMSTLLVY